MQLFESATMGSLVLPNRFVRSATAEGMATAKGYCSPALTKLMVRLAKGGVGLIITGHTAVSPEGRAAQRQLGLWHDDFIPAFVDMTGQTHDAGCKIMIQLSHAGIHAVTPVTGEAAMGPMVAKKADGTICRAMTREDIRRVTANFAAAARRAKIAGFDGVQIHAAHGYLLGAFLSPHYNHRLDEYGGTIFNRVRFLTEVLSSVFEAVGSEFPVTVKLNASDYLQGGLDPEDMLATVRQLKDFPLGAIELSGGTRDSGKRIPARPGKVSVEAEGYYRDDALRLKQVTQLPVILVGGIRSLEVCSDFLQDGVCDFIAMARPFIYEPDLISRWLAGLKGPAACQSDNLCYRPIVAGKGVFCLVKAREAQRQLLKMK